MNAIRETILKRAIELELFQSHKLDPVTNEKTPTYVEEGFDKERIEGEREFAEPYEQACVQVYYERHKKHLEDTVDAILKQALAAREEGDKVSQQ